jgi:DNA-binding MarR family transcriptional regulator
MVDDATSAVRTLTRLGRMLESALGDLSLPQYRVLAAVNGGRERASHLATGLAVAKPTVPAAVDGLVEREFSPASRSRATAGRCASA